MGGEKRGRMYRSVHFSLESGNEIEWKIGKMVRTGVLWFSIEAKHLRHYLKVLLYLKLSEALL